jgi:tetratricopeptide (TPR) repeat protein
LLEALVAMEPTFHVFLSHNSQDKPVVREIVKRLRERGLRPWLDEEELKPGRDWQEELEQVVKSIPAAAVLVGKDGIGPWEGREMRALLLEFVRRNVPVIPVLLPGAAKKPDLPLFLQTMTWIDFRSGVSSHGIDRLVYGIRGVRGAPLDLERPLATAADLRQATRLVTGRWPRSRRWRDALLRELRRRYRVYASVATLALLATLGFVALRRCCGAGGEAAGPLFGSALLSSLCSPEELYNEAVISWQKLDRLKAQQLFAKAIAKRPDYWLAVSGLALVLQELGQKEQAAVKTKLACNNAAELSSREERLLVTARCSYAKHEWGEAIKNYEELDRSFPNHIDYGLGVIKALVASGRFSEALEAVDLLRQNPAMTNQAARRDLAEAEAAYQLPDRRRMYAAAIRAEKEADHHGDERLRARAWLLQGFALHSYDPENALASFKKAEDFYSRTRDRLDQAHAMDAAAEVLLVKGRLGESRAKTDEAMKIFQEVGDRDGMTRPSLRVAILDLIVDFDQGNVKEAEKRFAAAISDYRRADDRQQEALFASNLGVVLGSVGHRDEAIRYLKLALDLYRGLNDSRGAARQWLYLSEWSLEQLRLQDAEEQLKEAQRLAADTSSQDLIAEALVQEGELGAVRGKSDLAKKRYQDAQARYTEIGDRLGVARCDLLLAELELDQCENHVAEADAHSALSQFQQLQFKDPEAEAGAFLALALVAEGSLSDAESKLGKAKRLAKESQDPDIKVTLALADGRLRAAKGQFEEALQDLSATLEKAQQAGLGRRVLAVELTMGEIEMELGDRNHASQVLTALERDARSHGLFAVAERAALARARGPAGVCSAR